MTPLPPITPESDEDFGDVERLIETAFGPGRLVKTAERLRENRLPAQGLSVVAKDEAGLVGCARVWDIHIGETPALLLGPFAVAAGWQSRGLGAALIEAACERARGAGHELVLLVGDAAYFSRCGFEPVGRDAIRLPGPVDMRRVLVRALAGQDISRLTGDVRAG